jgi:excisionase family DNA binding protein
MNDIPVLSTLALRPKAAARVLNVSERLLRTWTKQGRVPHIRVGRVVLYPTNLLLEWLSQQTVKPEGGEQ